jgi:hypothetical protein
VTEPTAATIAHQAATIVDIEAALTMANGRPPSDMEISLLVQVARECDPAAQAQGYGPGTGLGWVLAAIWEAVNSGSQFVAPKRIAAICDRWVTEGFGSDHRSNPTPPPAPVPPPTWPMSSLSDETPTTPPPATSRTESGAFPAISDSGTFPALPPEPVTDGESQWLWEEVMRRLGGVLHPDALTRWFTGARIASIESDRVTVAVPGADVALKLASYRGLISRRMSEALGRTVDVVFQATQLSSSPAPPPPEPVQPSTRVDESSASGESTSPWWWPNQAAGDRRRATGDAPRHSSGEPPVSQPSAPSLESTRGASSVPANTPPAGRAAASSGVPVGASGLTNRQIWAMALSELETRVNGAAFAVWLRPAELIGVDPDGTLVIGARNSVQRERLDRLYREHLVAALTAVVGKPVGIRIAIIGAAGEGAIA